MTKYLFCLIFNFPMSITVYLITFFTQYDKKITKGTKFTYSFLSWRTKFNLKI